MKEEEAKMDEQIKKKNKLKDNQVNIRE